MMNKVDIGSDDFITGSAFVKLGSVASAIVKVLLANGSPNKFQAERDAWLFIHTGIVAGKLHPLAPETLDILSINEYGNGVVGFDELVEWGLWCHRFDFVKESVSLQKAIPELEREVKRIVELESDPTLRIRLSGRFILTADEIADSIKENFIVGKVIYDSNGAPDPARSTIAANELPRFLEFIRRALEEKKASYLKSDEEENDPALSQERKVGWWDFIMDARTWLSMPNVKPEHAAMVLSRLNPNSPAVCEDPESIYVDGDESSPHRYRLLLRVFESEASTSPKHRTLMEWRAIAQQYNLRYHTWIDDYAEAMGAPASEQAVFDTIKNTSSIANDPPAKMPAPKRQRQDALAVELDEILVSMTIRKPAKVMAELRKQIGKPITCILRNVGDGIEWENNHGNVKALTIRMLGERIKEWKKTGLSQG